ncbi:MAG: hypothetical protein RSE41_00415 [Clostridia bacterium]
METSNKKTALLNELFDLIKETNSYRAKTPGQYSPIVYTIRAKYEKYTQKALRESIVEHKESLEEEKRKYAAYVERNNFLTSPEGIKLIQNNTAKLKEIEANSEALKKEYHDKLSYIIEIITNGNMRLYCFNRDCIEISVYDKQAEKFINATSTHIYRRIYKETEYLYINISTCGSFDMKDNNAQYLKYIYIAKILEYTNNNEEFLKLWSEYNSKENIYDIEFNRLLEEMKS